MIKFIEPTSKDEVVGFLVFTDKDQSIYKVIAADEPIIEIYKAYRAYRADIIPEYVIDIIKSNIIKDIEEYENAGNENMAMACKICFDFIDIYFQKES